MSKNNQAALKARTLFNTRCDGVLSTHSIDLPGYPFGSITPYCFNRHGQAVILISTIAQHTKNIKANNKVSLIAFESIRVVREVREAPEQSWRHRHCPSQASRRDRPRDSA